MNAAPSMPCRAATSASKVRVNNPRSSRCGVGVKITTSARVVVCMCTSTSCQLRQETTMAERDSDASVGHRCRACGYDGGTVVLDLGSQPPADLFPPVADPGPDPSYPLQMWLCARCALAQLTSDATTPEEPLGVEPRALVTQANAAV